MANQTYTFGPKIMTRYGKIVLSEEASQFMGITENTCVKLMADDTPSSHYLVITSSEDSGGFKIKTSGIYCYITCVDLLKALGLYSPDPTIYELIKEVRGHGESVFRLAKIAAITDPKIGSTFPYRGELRRVIDMLNFNI